VYDCGGSSKKLVGAQIDRLISEIAPAAVDAVFLSHLDQDHVKGFEELCSKLKDEERNVKAVFLPYLGAAELAAHLAGILSRTFLLKHYFLWNDGVADAYLDPSAWFGERGVEIVYLVGGAESSSTEFDFVPSDPELPPSTSEGLGEELPPLDIPDVESTPAGKPFESSGPGQKANVRHVNPGHGQILKAPSIALSWLLLPYCHPINDHWLKVFKEEVVRRFGLKGETSIDLSFLKDTLRTPWKRTKLKQCYNYTQKLRSGNSDHNTLSLSLYSGLHPGVEMSHHVEGFYWCSSQQQIIHGRSFFHTWKEAAWIGTGDAKLKDKSIRDKWKNFFSPIMEQLVTLILPHHGSRFSFDESILDSHSLKFCVAASNPQHKRYRHPHSQVVDAVGRHGKDLISVTKDQRSRFIEGMYWKRWR